MTDNCVHCEAGTTKVHEELERLIASYVGKPAAITFGMGFATNSTTLPALVGKVVDNPVTRQTTDSPPVLL